MGGGPGSFFGNFSDRSDYDVLAVWQFRNLGLGDLHAIREASSRYRQANLHYRYTRDVVAEQVTAAFHRLQARSRQIDVARSRIHSSAKAIKLNFNGIRGGGIRPIEAQQAIQALDAARREYLNAVIGHNQAQFELLRGIGNPPNRKMVP